MRVLLVALNARYVHTSLALRYLREAIKPHFSEVILKEFTINEHTEKIASEIYEVKADVIGFSCYIWNIKETLAVIRHLHPVSPKVRFVLGGPEVSFESEELLRNHPQIDAIIAGEGEGSFPELLKAWECASEPNKVPGLIWRRQNNASTIEQAEAIIANPPLASVKNLSELPMPYGTEEDFKGRIVYVETTRGCPFNCQYCLSSTFSGMRYLEPDNFRVMFKKLLSLGARTIKFVDRTFNTHKEHSFEILDIVHDEAQGYEEVRVHCEMAGDLIDEEWLEYLANYPSGLIQLEIGVQSTNLPTLEIISRVQRFEEWKDKVYTLQNLYQIPIHLDLIAGLPEETFERFSQSFNEVYRAYPNRLQLGFLKVLKGSGIRQKSLEYGLKYTPDPPYTILETKHITHSELLQLARIEELLEKYYNSGKFRTSLKYLLDYFSSPFNFYDEFAGFWQENGWFKQPLHGKSLFEKLWAFILHIDIKESNELDRLRDALRFDYYLWERPASVPEFLESALAKEGEGFNLQQEQIRRDPIWKEVVSDYDQMDRRRWSRATAVGLFTHIVAADSDYKIKKVSLKSEPPAVKGNWYLFFYNNPLAIYLIN